MSPPDSSSDDEDLPELRSQARGRQAGDLKALHEAISQISQDRSSSPSKTTTAETGTSDARDMVSVASHASAISEEDSDEDAQRKPQMVRKKSGELVRPALRPPSRRRPSSMPGTPTFSKAVHFDSHLEHVRHFLQVDRPLAVSAGSSPAGNYDSDTEYPFTGDGRPAVGSLPFEWEIVMNNFPVETPARKAQPVRLDRVWLSNDQKCLTGSVVVANLAFQKFVTCRFTLDYWKTTSEVAAEYSCEVRPVQQPIGRDRFQFTIKLSDMANLEAKTLYFCIRYNVNGQEYWDNNGGMNFQADFQKKMLPQNGKKGTIGAASRPANGLPKSTRRSNPSTAPRPKSMPVGVDDFLDNPKLNFDQSLHDYLGEPAPASLRLKGVKSSSSLPSDNLPSRLSAPSGQAFANRYDFGASLTAAIQNAKDQLFERPDGLYMKSSRKSSAPPSGSSKPTGPGSSSPIKSLVPGHMKSSTVPGMDSPSPSIASASYEELVNKYCFFGSKQPSRPQVNGTDDASKSTTNSSATSSYEGSPVQMGNYRHYHSGTQHHSLHPRDPSSSYFYHSTSFVPIGASPAESPLQGFSSQQAASPLGNPPRPTAPPDKAANQSSTPASSVGDFAHLTGTSPNDYAYQHMHDRFPFSGGDAHAATAIRG